MPHKEIPTTSIQPGQSLSRHLAEVMRANRFYCDHVRQSNDSLMSNSSGHLHAVGATTAFSYSFSDRIEIVASSNDRLDFQYAGGATALGTFSASLTPATYTLASLASHLETKMRTAAGGVSDIDVSYDGPAGGSPGFFVIQHSGSSDSPNARIFKLLCASGSNGPTAATPRSVFPSIKFAAGKDRVGAFGYVGDGGFLDGFTQDSWTFGDGGQVGTSGIAAGAVTEAKLKDGILDGTHLSAAAVTGAKIQDSALTSAKTGSPVASTTALVPPVGGTAIITFAMGTAGRVPSCCIAINYVPYTSIGLPSLVYITGAPVHTGSGNYNVTVQNDNVSGINVTVQGFAY